MRQFTGGLYIHINGDRGLVDIHHTTADANAAHLAGKYARTMRYDGGQFGCRTVEFTTAAQRFIQYREDMINE